MMALVQKPESYSFRVVSTNGEQEVFAANASYSQRNVDVMFEFLDSEYCAANTQEVQNAMMAFFAKLNPLLTDAGITTIPTA